ncbi:MAG: IS630 transposase-related protein [Acidobacteriota bacterium]|nr:IS630 transposase-related protein [Acidobacteriota bacterium]
MKSYSLDLREKILETYKAGGITQRELATRFRVSTFFVVKLLGLYRRRESIQARRRGGRRKPLLSEPIREFIKVELTMQNDLTLPELIERVKKEFHVSVSAPTMCRALKQMQLPRKKRLSILQNEIRKE